LQFLESLTRHLNRALSVIAGVALVGMILLTCGNIFLRLVWLPIQGTFELLGFFGAVATTFALGYTQRYRMHIAVNVLVDRFSTPVRKVLRVVNGLMCMAFFGLAAWQIAEWSVVLVEAGEVTETLQMAYYPFTFATALGCAVLALVFLTEILQTILQREEG
jgi:TRAP-type C4-dicarboxylate transport system permease small subunit